MQAGEACAEQRAHSAPSRMGAWPLMTLGFRSVQATYSQFPGLHVPRGSAMFRLSQPPKLRWICVCVCVCVCVERRVNGDWGVGSGSFY